MPPRKTVTTTPQTIAYLRVSTDEQDLIKTGILHWRTKETLIAKKRPEIKLPTMGAKARGFRLADSSQYFAFLSYRQ